ncbi:tryptophan synthase subunit alpha [Bacillus sp. E214]|uniref:tryptophan synthase subunit alpha n=1 Tax=Bacillus sp. E214 TaxID=2587156 RepID=UPI0011E01E5C|nr:tryptophan synthase subunit alpha [Bacillus sp. E214]
MPNKLVDCFSEAKRSGEKGFIPYIMGGDGGINQLVPTIKYFERLEASAIEIGIPFSDPVADGPSIQEAGLRALEQDVNLEDILNELRNTEETIEIPLIIMTYANPVLRLGISTFAAKCREASISACIIPDVPLEEEQMFKKELSKEGIVLIRILPLTANPTRMAKLCDGAEGFIYAVTVNGTTGEQAQLNDEAFKEQILQLKQNTDCPIYAGFGISNAKTANQLYDYCDGIIVGSKVVSLLHQKGHKELESFVKELIRNKAKQTTS